MHFILESALRKDTEKPHDFRGGSQQSKGSDMSDHGENGWGESVREERTCCVLLIFKELRRNIRHYIRGNNLFQLKKYWRLTENKYSVTLALYLVVILGHWRQSWKNVVCLYGEFCFAPCFVFCLLISCMTMFLFAFLSFSVFAFDSNMNIQKKIQIFLKDNIIQR